ncbi:MAG TPA: MBL fold metallo-hydrolase [Steroidobacteraceae bacterium]|nr:MBL fold metallo-hydrolase [Steroidobacteraceae bacterium]
MADTLAGAELSPGLPRKLDRYVTRLVAPNASPMTGPGTNTYLVGERDLALIDPGPDDPEHIRAILAAARGRIRWILCTHTHSDHATGVAAVKNATGAEILGRPGAGNGTEHDVLITADRVLGDGDELDVGGVTLQVIQTPGHASNHLCFLLRDTGMLFTGDHIMQGSTVVIWPPDGNMRAYIRSLERLLSLPIEVIAPGHGYLIEQPREEVSRLIKHRLAREDKVRSALREATAGANADRKGVELQRLLPRVYDDVPVSLHPVAVLSLQAHLEKLVEDGEARFAAGRYAAIS